MRTVARAAAILRALADSPSGASLGQIAKYTGLARSTVQRIVGGLAAERLVASDGRASSLRLGPEVARLAAAVHRDLIQVFKPILQRLHAEVEDTVDLTMLQGGAAVVVDQVASARALRVVSHIGTPLPLHCTASGKAHLQLLCPIAAREHLVTPLKAHTPNSMTVVDTVLTTLAMPSGLSVDEEEFAIGVCALALPIRAPHLGNIAVAVSMPKLQFEAHADRVSAALERCRAALERASGADPGP